MVLMICSRGFAGLHGCRPAADSPGWPPSGACMARRGTARSGAAQPPVVPSGRVGAEELMAPPLAVAQVAPGQRGGRGWLSAGAVRHGRPGA